MVPTEVMIHLLLLYDVHSYVKHNNYHNYSEYFSFYLELVLILHPNYDIKANIKITVRIISKKGYNPHSCIQNIQSIDRHTLMFACQLIPNEVDLPLSDVLPPTNRITLQPQIGVYHYQYFSKYSSI